MSNTDKKIARRGLMLVLAAPSGCGKSTISRQILADDDDITLSVSATTRDPRPREVDGEHYFFLNVDDFKAKASNGDFLESAEVFGRFYGTPKAPVEEALSQGKDVFFDIDWQGAEQLRSNAPDDLVWVCVLPPNKAALGERLRARGQDSDEVIAKRMAEAASESSHWVDADYVVVNDHLDKATAQVQAILRAERLKRVRRTGLSDFVEGM